MPNLPLSAAEGDGSSFPTLGGLDQIADLLAIAQQEGLTPQALLRMAVETARKKATPSAPPVGQGGPPPRPQHAPQSHADASGESGGVRPLGSRRGPTHGIPLPDVLNDGGARLHRFLMEEIGPDACIGITGSRDGWKVAVWPTENQSPTQIIGGGEWDYNRLGQVAEHALNQALARIDGAEQE